MPQAVLQELDLVPFGPVKREQGILGGMMPLGSAAIAQE
jgi:hypothetical protein